MQLLPITSNNTISEKEKNGSFAFQIKAEFDKMLSVGESKFLDKKADRTQNKIYSWESYGETEFNFEGVEVDISFNRCWITINLQLDPPVWLNSEWTHKQNNLEEPFTATKLESVFYSCVEAVEYLKEKELI